MNLILCADSCCLKKDTCKRFTTHPLNEIRVNHKIRIEPTLRHQEEKECRKYKAISLTKLER